jgi:hypothetical protein
VFRHLPALVSKLLSFGRLCIPKPFPNDLRNPLNIKMPARVIATMVLHREMWNINAVTKEIAAPTKLYGSHLLIAKANSIFIMMIMLVYLHCVTYQLGILHYLPNPGVEYVQVITTEKWRIDIYKHRIEKLT